MGWCHEWIICLQKPIVQKVRCLQKPPVIKMLKKVMYKMCIFYTKSVSKLGGFSPPVFLSLCYTFVLHPCVTPKIRQMGIKKHLINQGAIRGLVAEEGIEPPTHGL